MVSLQSPALTSILALASMFLALSLLVQVLQELYKYLRSTKTTAYQKALLDFIGPWAKSLVTAGSLPDVRVRGPMQMKKLRPTGRLLPLKKESLVNSLERTAPPWVQNTLRQLEVEVEIQGGKSSEPSDGWKAFLSQLSAAEEGSAGYWSARSIAGFLSDWRHEWKQPETKKTKSGKHLIRNLGDVRAPETLDAPSMLKAFRLRFLGDVEYAAKNFDQFTANFEYTYRRLNTRLTFVISFVIALVGNLSVEQLWKRASSMSPETAVAYAQSVLQLSEEAARSAGPEDSAATARVALAKKLAAQLLPDSTELASPGGLNYVVDVQMLGTIWSAGFLEVIRYLFGCLLTAVLVSFGAPFWNDIASALLRLQKGGRKPASAGVEESNG